MKVTTPHLFNQIKKNPAKKTKKNVMMVDSQLYDTYENYDLKLYMLKAK